MSRAAAGVFAGWLLAAGLAFFLERETAASAPGLPSRDPLTRLVGGVTEAVGDTVFLKADAYLHGGVGADWGEESDQMRETEGHIAAAPAAPDWIAAVNAKVREHSHYHLSAEKQKEMLPLFAIALKLDPYNVEAVLTTAYWLDRHEGKAEQAIAVLEKGSRDNPESWEIDYRLAHLLLRRRGAPGAARPRYEASLEKMGSRTDVPDYMRRNAWYSLGEIYETAGEADRARQAFEAALRYFKPGEPEGLRRAILEKLGRSS